MAVAMALLSTTVHASSVWDKTITHPLSGGRLLAGDRCHFATTNCAGTGTHLGVDVMAAGGTQVVAMCPGTVKHNNTATASIWNSKVIVEHNCGAQFQKIYGYYGHVASDLAVDAFIESGAAIGTLKDDGANSHLHMGVNYFYQVSEWGYGSSTTNWLDFQSIVYRPIAKPTLNNPSVAADVLFTWSAVPSATSYRIVISQDPNPLRNFDNLTRACNGTQNGGSACWTNDTAISTTNVSKALTTDKTYYWVVRANNSDWSDIGVFSTGSAAVSDTSWSSGAYAADAYITKTLSMPGTSRLSVTVTGITEAGFDFLYVRDSNNNLVTTLSGVLNETFEVSGSSIHLTFTSDGWINESGITVSIKPAGTTVSEATKAEGILNCIEKLLPTYFSNGMTQPWRQSDQSIAYVRQYSRLTGDYQQAVWRGFWFYDIGEGWRQANPVDDLKRNFCPNAW